ncbi:MAG TPA: hypothetical protein VN667_07450 [Burkholderiales bacterium]|nr:hypothetical protein [Burkholderiales bacterium]
MTALAIIGLVAGLILAVLGVVAGADPEGRGGAYVLAGPAGFIIAVICAIYLIVITVQHYWH